jgi:hypothetical protein
MLYMFLPSAAAFGYAPAGIDMAGMDCRSILHALNRDRLLFFR